MRYYILSSKNCEVKLNGEYLGVANGNLALLPCENNGFLLQLIPSYFYKSINATIKNGETNNQNISIIDLYGNFLIIPHFVSETFSRFEIVFDRFYDDINLRLSVIFDGFLKLIAENQFGSFCKPLNLECFSPTVTCDIYDNYLAVSVSNIDRINFYLLDISNKPKLVLNEQINRFKQNANTFVLTKNLPLINVERTEKSITLSPFSCQTKVYKKNEVATLPTPLIPYAFIQELQYGFDFECYLSQELKANASYIKDFLGDFFAFAPAPHLDINSNEYNIIIIGKRARILTVSLCDNLVCDLNIL